VAEDRGGVGRRRRHEPRRVRVHKQLPGRLPKLVDLRLKRAQLLQARDLARVCVCTRVCVCDERGPGWRARSRSQVCCPPHKALWPAVR
jgi:hypothetical protein